MGICRRREKLLDDYGAVTAEFRERARAVAAAAISYEAPHFQRLWDSCEAARLRCAQIRHELTADIQEHGCQLDLFNSSPGEQSVKTLR